jgi:hypothetical protein
LFLPPAPWQTPHFNWPAFSATFDYFPLKAFKYCGRASAWRDTATVTSVINPSIANSVTIFLIKGLPVFNVEDATV